MGKFSKKAMSLILCAAMAATAFAGCGGGGSASSAAPDQGKAEAGSSAPADGAAPAAGGNADISGTVVFAAGRDQTGAIQKNIDEFKAAYPGVEVDWQILPGNSDDVKKGIMNSLAAGDTDPDVLVADIIWVPQFASAGWLMDVSEQINAVKDQYVAGPLSTCYINDKYYAFPDYTDVGLLYYRSDLIEAPPKTWDELVAMSKEHIGKDGIEYGYVFQAFQGEPVVCNALEFIKQNGGNDLQDGKFVINSENTVEALQFMRQMIDDKIAPEGVLTHKPDDTRAIFEEGKALFMRNWTYAYGNAQLDTSKVKGKVGVAALPVGPKGSESSGTLGGWNLAINAASDVPEAAIAFAQFLSGETGQKNRTTMASTFPTLKATYEDADVQAQLPYLGELKSAADQAKPRPQVVDYSAISSVMSIYLHKALTLDTPYEEALAQMTTELEAALAKQK